MFVGVFLVLFLLVSMLLLGFYELVGVDEVELNDLSI